MLNGFHGYLFDALNISLCFCSSLSFQIIWLHGRKGSSDFILLLYLPTPHLNVLIITETFQKTHQLFSGKYLHMVCVLRFFHPSSQNPSLEVSTSSELLYPDAYTIPINTSLSSHPFPAILLKFFKVIFSITEVSNTLSWSYNVWGLSF